MTLDEKFSVRHIIKEGARYHVHSYALCRSRKRMRENFAVSWCSEAFCEDNLFSVKKCIREGQDPAELCPSCDAKDWLRSKEGRAAVKAEQLATV